MVNFFQYFCFLCVWKQCPIWKHWNIFQKTFQMRFFWIFSLGKGSYDTINNNIELQMSRDDSYNSFQNSYVFVRFLVELKVAANTQMMMIIVFFPLNLDPLAFFEAEFTTIPNGHLEKFENLHRISLMHQILSCHPRLE